MSIWGYVAIFVPIFIVILALVIWAVILGQRHRVVTGREGLEGETGVAESTLNPKGTVFIDGEHWKAVAESGRIEPGEEVVVTKIEGLKLTVTRKSK